LIEPATDDDLQDLWDDMAEMMEENKMIQDAMGRAFDTPTDLDESELEAELEALGDEVFPSFFPSFFPRPSAPRSIAI